MCLVKAHDRADNLFEQSLHETILECSSREMDVSLMSCRASVTVG